MKKIVCLLTKELYIKLAKMMVDTLQIFKVDVQVLLVSLRALAAECRDTEACPFQILSRFTQPHRLCSWSQSEIYQNLDSNRAATLGPRAQL